MLSSAEGDFGRWDYPSQTSGSIVGIWMRGQDPSGPNCLGPWKWCDHRKGDDTAANGVRFLDSNGEMKKPGECLELYLALSIHILQLCLLRYAFIKCLLGDGHWGIWSYSSCPPGYSVVGFRTQVVPSCKACDKVALARAEFRCRPQAGPISPYTCALASCPSGNCFYLCGDGDCVAASRECDGTPDCGDGSDEHSECGTSQWCTPEHYDCVNEYWNEYITQ